MLWGEMCHINHTSDSEINIFKERWRIFNLAVLNIIGEIIIELSSSRITNNLILKGISGIVLCCLALVMFNIPRNDKICTTTHLFLIYSDNNNQFPFYERQQNPPRSCDLTLQAWFPSDHQT